MEVSVNQIEKRSWVEIDLSQIKRNYLIYKNSLKKNADIMAVIKADAYGHNDVQVARMLEGCGVRYFAVSNIDEAVGLRDAGINGDILILGYSSPYYCRTLYERNLTQSVVSEEYAKALYESGFAVKCQIAIDTGMNRIGLDGDMPDVCESVIRKYFKQLNITGLFTHLCVADTDTEHSKEFTYNQIKKFKQIANAVADLRIPYKHCCNSAAGLLYLRDDDLFDGIGEIVRLGIVLYGLKPANSFVLPDGIRPALAWKSTISMVKKIYPDETVGYGRTFRAEKEMTIATVTTGYADGLNRNLSNKGYVLVRGARAPIIGMICMDQTLIDVSNIKGIKMGDAVTILGKSGEIEYNADDMAADLGTIGYEVMCGISKRVQRFFATSNASL